MFYNEIRKQVAKIGRGRRLDTFVDEIFKSAKLWMNTFSHFLYDVKFALDDEA